MDKAKYTGYSGRNFPLSTEGLSFIQSQIMATAELAKAIGGNYILSGAETAGNNVSDGWLILEGEILPLKGGMLQDTIRIIDVAENVTAGIVVYENAYNRRYAEFGASIGGVNQYDWLTIKRLPTNKQLDDTKASRDELDEIKNQVMPKGAIIMWSGDISAIPAGFSLCDGLTVNGLKKPDLRGRFVVGFNPDSLNTPDVAPTGVENYGKVGNRGGATSVLLTAAQSGLPDHNHAFSFRSLRNNSASGTGNTSLYGHDDIYYTNNSGGSPAQSAHENRPPYYVLAYIIKIV